MEIMPDGMPTAETGSMRASLTQSRCGLEVGLISDAVPGGSIMCADHNGDPSVALSAAYSSDKATAQLLSFGGIERRSTTRRCAWSTATDQAADNAYLGGDVTTDPTTRSFIPSRKSQDTITLGATAWF